MKNSLPNLGLKFFNDCPYGWLSLCQSQIRLHDYQEAEKSAKKGMCCQDSHFLVSAISDKPYLPTSTVQLEGI